MGEKQRNKQHVQSRRTLLSSLAFLLNYYIHTAALTPQSYGAYSTQTPPPSCSQPCTCSLTSGGNQGRRVCSTARSRTRDGDDEEVEGGRKSRWYHLRIMDSRTVRVLASTVFVVVCASCQRIVNFHMQARFLPPRPYLYSLPPKHTLTAPSVPAKNA